MQANDYYLSALFEHRFWLQIAGDHSRFIKDALSSDEIQEIQQANFFIQAFDQLLNQARSQQAFERLDRLNTDALQLTQELRAFKLHLLQRELTGKIKLHLSQTFLNHMVNEIEEYLRILGAIRFGKPVPVFTDVHHHLLWLLDAVGHAGTIVGLMDITEKAILEKGRAFEKQFQDFYMKAVELAGFLRTNLTQFPALSRFNQNVELEMILFRQFLRELEELELSREALGVLTPLMADHMAREECYYLIKLAQTGGVQVPACDPAKPRIES